MIATFAVTLSVPKRAARKSGVVNGRVTMTVPSANPDPDKAATAAASRAHMTLVASGYGDLDQIKVVGLGRMTGPNTAEALPLDLVRPLIRG